VNIPNTISLTRLFAVPVTIWLILIGELLPAFWLFVAAGVSDAIDGFIAKRFNCETEFGKFLDPIADKALLVGVYIALGHEGYVGTWLVIMVVFRDVIIVGGALLFQTLTQSLTMEPLMISKVNTATQIVFAALVLGLNGFGLEARVVVNVLAFVVALTTLLSGVHYVFEWSRRASAAEE
jgi:cardiolipin synthase